MKKKLPAEPRQYNITEAGINASLKRVWLSGSFCCILIGKGMKLGEGEGLC